MSFDYESSKKNSKQINTPWGIIIPQVEIFPVAYIVILYGLIYFLPLNIFDIWSKGEDGLVEWIQFILYFFSFACSLVVTWHRRNLGKQFFFWLLITALCFYIAGEEISWAERITSIGIESIRQINAQGETNLHNIPIFQNYLHFSFIITGLFFGWIGWKNWPQIEAFPRRSLSLYFLIVSLFYTYFDLSWITLGERIRNDQEAIEILMAIGLFRHCSYYASKVFSKKENKFLFSKDNY
tara:strand:- start:52 stop:768 length:717 start_codon:yes stop_codon:yes gene_type:complete